MFFFFMQTSGRIRVGGKYTSRGPEPSLRRKPRAILARHGFEAPFLSVFRLSSRGKSGDRKKPAVLRANYRFAATVGTHNLDHAQNAMKSRSDVRLGPQKLAQRQARSMLALLVKVDFTNSMLQQS
jgi:hypothetical protein